MQMADGICIIRLVMETRAPDDHGVTTKFDEPLSILARPGWDLPARPGPCNRKPGGVFKEDLGTARGRAHCPAP
jgi:hypothetical protein